MAPAGDDSVCEIPTPKKDGIPGGLIIVAVPNPVRVDHFSYSFAKIWNPA